MRGGSGGGSGGVSAVGLDIGSTTSKAVLLRRGELLASAVVPAGTGTNGPDRAVAAVLERAGVAAPDVLVATGYGRNLYTAAHRQVSEMSCHARGAAHLLPGVDTVIDIGGQDVKVLRLDGAGNLEDFVMNDKCAAGTGRFLEVMARVLQVEAAGLAALAEGSRSPVQISSVCTVFAESEVISHLSAGAERADIAAGIHRSVAKRTAGLVRRLAPGEVLAITGGVAQNGGVVRCLEEALGRPVLVPPAPQAVGALGAALYAAEAGKE